jgi:hypothetical protein
MLLQAGDCAAAVARLAPRATIGEEARTMRLSFMNAPRITRC